MSGMSTLASTGVAKLSEALAGLKTEWTTGRAGQSLRATWVSILLVLCPIFLK